MINSQCDVFHVLTCYILMSWKLMLISHVALAKIMDKDLARWGGTQPSSKVQNLSHKQTDTT